MAAPLQVSPIDPDDALHWLALLMVPGLGARRTVPLIEKFRTAQAIFRASRSELVAAGLPPSLAQTIASGVTFEEGAEQLQLAQKHQVTIVPLSDPRFPPLLRQIYDPPLLLFARGNLEMLQRPCLAVVGTRRPTPYGLAATERLASELAAAGLIITSGMARGIDTAAHRAALAVPGGTAAVFGSGIDHIYPAENRRLADEIAAKGVILSEYPIGSPGHPQNFPVRNRIISGMSVGVLVVEGAQYSGSAITASLAAEQGREVFAVPGNITSKMSWAPNLLIKQGAHLVQAAEDVLTALDPDVRATLAIPERPTPSDPAQEISRTLGPSAKLGREILERLQPDRPLHIDEILETLDNYSSSEVFATLFQMQLLGVVRELPGKNFVTVWVDRPPPAG